MVCVGIAGVLKTIVTSPALFANPRIVYGLTDPSLRHQTAVPWSNG